MQATENPNLSPRNSSRARKTVEAADKKSMESIAGQRMKNQLQQPLLTEKVKRTRLRTMALILIGMIHTEKRVNKAIGVTDAMLGVTDTCDGAS